MDKNVILGSVLTAVLVIAGNEAVNYVKMKILEKKAKDALKDLFS